MSAKEARKRAARYLETAALLLKEGDYESSVSRAYYAMFYVAREVLHQRGIEPKTHSGTLNQFSLHVVKAGDIPVRFSKMFGDAQELRELGEYAEERVLSREEAEATLREAEEFVGRISGLLGESA